VCRVWSRNLKNEEAMTRVASQRHRKKLTELPNQNPMFSTCNTVPQADTVLSRFSSLRLMAHCHPNRIKCKAVPVCATKLCGEWRYSSSHSESRCRRWMATFTPPSLYLRVNSHRVLNGRRSAPQTQSWIFGVQKSRLPRLGMEPRFLSCKGPNLVTVPIMPSRLHICLYT